MTEETKEQEQKAPVYCPNGCGTILVKRKFVNAFEENGKPSLKDVEENLYCPKCCIRWIPEQQSTILGLLEKEIEIKYEQVKIKVPKPLMAFLRFQSEHENFESVEKLIEYDLIANVRAEFEGTNGEELIAMFNLSPIFWKILGDKHYKPKDAAPKKKVMLDQETIEYAKKHNIDINEAAKQHLERLKAENKKGAS